MRKSKFRLLRNSILLDAVGVATSFIPGVGEIFDILWAPFAAKKMSDMYPGEKGKIASVIVFIEEIIPGTDFIPTFTLMWLYTFVFGQEKQSTPHTIEVEINE